MFSRVKVKLIIVLENQLEVEKMRLAAQQIAQNTYTHFQEVDAIDNLLKNA
jgi:hypothetical protein